VHEVGKRSAALEGPTSWKRDAGSHAANHTPGSNRCFHLASRRPHLQRRSVEISGLLASRASNVAYTFCSWDCNMAYFWGNVSICGAKQYAIWQLPSRSYGLFRFFGTAFPDGVDEHDLLQSYGIWEASSGSITTIVIGCILGAMVWLIIDEPGSRYLFAFLMHHICDHYTFSTGKCII